MSKIVQAVNAMICNPDKISNVIRNEDEIFFLYKNKYKWSMLKNDSGDHVLWYYPGDERIDQLAYNDWQNWEHVNMVTYKDSEIGTKEAKASFAELYTLLKECVFGVNQVLDDIISDSDLL